MATGVEESQARLGQWPSPANPVSYSKVEHKVIISGDQVIPAKVCREPRLNIRSSISRKGAVLRLPLGIPPPEYLLHASRFEQWVKKQVASSEALSSAFTQRHYHTGYQFTVGERRYQLVHEPANNRSTSSATCQGGTVTLRVVQGLGPVEHGKTIRHLLSRVVARDFMPEVQLRVHELNAIHFQKKIGKISLKYNHSNWGSCSSRGNINLSTCLLFAPPAAMDYVIIHELAHLVEMNHSSRFWELVSRAMPGYQLQVRWLKENWHSCDF